jgi:hypothetical protein
VRNVLPLLRLPCALAVPAVLALWIATGHGFEQQLSCPVTAMPPGGMLRNSGLEVPITPDGTITFGAGRPGFVLPDGALMIKYGWVRLRAGRFSIHGRRLDRHAPPLRASIAERAHGENFQPASLIFPTAGCWEVTGQLDDEKLTFVVRVIALEGIPRGPPSSVRTTNGGVAFAAYGWQADLFDRSRLVNLRRKGGQKFDRLGSVSGACIRSLGSPKRGGRVPSNNRWSGP